MCIWLPILVPAAIVAIYRSLASIRRLMFRAPLLMMGLFAVVALAAGIWVGQPRVFSAVAGLGAVVSLVLGYAYVGLAVAVRRQFGPRPA